MMRAGRWRLRALVTLLSGILIWGCSSDPLPQDYRFIYGTWDWVKAVGVAEFEMTPESAGFELTYTFARGGLFEIYRSGFLEAKTTFSFAWDT